MLAIQNLFTMKYFNEIKLRSMIFLFLYLALAFSRLFILSSSKTHPEFAVWGIVFFDATVIIIFNLRYGNSHIGRDVNTLNFYGLIFHLLYLVFYFQGYQVAFYHNTAIKIINALIVLRLFYFGDRELLSRIAIIEHIKAIFHEQHGIVGTYINGLTIALFLLSAVPLFILIYIINTDEMRIIVIALCYLLFLLPSNFLIKEKNIQSTVPESALSEAQQAELTQVKNSRDAYASLAKGLGIIIIVGGLFSASLMRTKESTFFNFGYSDGYSDGKNGKEPISKEHREKLLDCYRYDPNTIPRREPDPDCAKIDRSGWR